MEELFLGPLAPTPGLFHYLVHLEMQPQIPQQETQAEWIRSALRQGEESLIVREPVTDIDPVAGIDRTGQVTLGHLFSLGQVVLAQTEQK